MSVSARYPELAGKRVIVTGGASGIGLCLVKAYLEQGCSVVAIDRDVEAIKAATNHLRGFAVRFETVDLSFSDRAAAIIQKAFGSEGVDILITNAANDARHAWDEVSPENWRNSLAVNLDHQFFCAQAAARDMVSRGKGIIIFFGSITAQRPRASMVSYIAAKSAVEGMTRALARELGQLNVRVTAIVPGAIDTPRQRQLWWTPESEALIRDNQALPELLDGRDVAALALFLSSDGARGCTGQTYSIDGGLT